MLKKILNGGPYFNAGVCFALGHLVTWTKVDTVGAIIIIGSFVLDKLEDIRAEIREVCLLLKEGNDDICN